jgi:NADPH-dependent glutamate synthase beta subunit-like oxidoreductase/dihydroorotate dehydrogenase/Pyruvate/2-oxoacid:ferredoxin oxidoreductase delta subunit
LVWNKNRSINQTTRGKCYNGFILSDIKKKRRNMQKDENRSLMTCSQLQTELLRCEYCEEKPCREACPVHCSPADFIMAARVGNWSDIRRSAAEIMQANPLGGVCGMVCPDTLCMAACTRKKFDGPINIPLVQATIVEMAKDQGGIPNFTSPNPVNKKVAIVGGGPAGLSAAAVLGQLGYHVDILESHEKLGGMLNLIPDHRLNKRVVETDINFLLSLGNINPIMGKSITDPKSLFKMGYEAVCVTTGLWKPIEMGIENESLSIRMVDLLADPSAYNFDGRVAVIGGGATALDCAVTARKRGATNVELFMLEKLSEMPLTAKERGELLDFDIEINCRIRVSKILTKNNRIYGVETVKMELPEGTNFSPANVHEIAGTTGTREDFCAVVIAIGMRSSLPGEEVVEGLYYAGDLRTGPKTVVEASASGKNVALEIDAWLQKKEQPEVKKPNKSYYQFPGYNPTPVPLETKFFGRKIISPFLVSASPSSDGFDQMVKAYQAGWAGGVMKTAFDNMPIHIPNEYMFTFGQYTYANSDNVSGHPLDRVCGEVTQLVKLWPDRLTMASTGGPVSGNDEHDSRAWQSNTKKLESAGAMGIEYSLSCPQGGDGTEGDIVSQNAALTAKIVDWVMQVSDPEIPKLFKLTAAVTSIVPILRAIRKVFDNYPGKKAGITLANSFPTLAFRPSLHRTWDEGVIVGMSGEGVTPISYLSLTQAMPEGIEISGNAGPMNYKAAMDFLALGVKTVQFCTIVMKQGYGIVKELESGISYLMQERGIHSMKELIGIAWPDPITDFMSLTPIKQISDVDPGLCVSCGNCTRCPYLAISFDEAGILRTDPSRCIGCSICAKKCFTGAISMRARTKDELAMLKEQ